MFTPAPVTAAPKPVHQHVPGPTAAPTTTAAPPTSAASGPTYQPTQSPSRGPSPSGHKSSGVNPNKKHHPKPPRENDKTPKVKTHTPKPTKPKTTLKRGTFFPGASSAPAPKPAKAHSTKKASGGSSNQLSFVPAAFHRPSPSALSTGLDLLGLLALLVFSSLALWLVTTEVSTVTANARRQRTHRIAGITDRR